MKKNLKICLISSSGGHFEQLKMLKQLKTKYDIYIVTEKTEYKENLELLLEIPEEKMEMVKSLNIKTEKTTKKYVEI